MRNIDHYQGKKVTIAGLARSGIASANLLYGLGLDVRVTDSKDNDATRSAALKLRSKDIQVELGRHSREFIKGRDLIIASPGVPNNAVVATLAAEFGIPVISEIELAWDLCPAKVIAVTGSNGKTTVTTLIGRILEAAGKKVFVCGNIGNPFSGEVEKIKEDDYVCLETSSFQLERIQRFRPKIAVMLNFTSNHMDRHKDMREYLEAKKRVFMNQEGTDHLVLNYEDPVLRSLAGQAKANIVYFSGTPGLNPNYAAVLAVGSILGIDKNLVSGILRDFKGIEHRLEYVAEINNIKFINDSKATTADSAAWALKSINSPVVLIAGGKDKGVDYSVILDLAREKARGIILIGEAREKIARALKGFPSIDEAATLEDAVRKAYALAKAGDSVLLSPMCSSFDMFSDYEQRGRVFKEAVYALAKEES
ncbi:MAG: UDP-N-acetylmuramoyl-L-alanine--D-glutamate ligase [Candidatus Omnitrophota bacterium]